MFDTEQWDGEQLMKRGTAIAIPLGLLASLPGVRAEAAGFQLQEQSASGLGVAYSGMPAAAQDASVAFWNPAALPLLDGVQLTAAVHYIDTSFDFVSAGPPPAGSTYNALGDGGNGGGGTMLPALYGRMGITPRLAAGLAINAPFGLKTDWPAPWAGMFSAVRSEVKTLNINPSLGYRLSPHVLLGAGVSYERLQATLTNGVTPLAPAAIGHLEGSDWKFGWNAGALFEWNSTRVGVTYRSSIGYRVEGALTFNSPAFASLASDVRADLRLPSTLAVGISQDVGQHTRLLADVTWTGWDSVQSLTVVATSGARAGLPVASTPLNFRNSWRAGLGAEQKLTAKWLVRAGIAYDRSPVQDEFRTPRLPDDDRRWLAAGVRFSPNQQLSFDVGYAHLWVQKAPSTLTPVGAVPGVLRGQYENSSDVFGAQAAFRF